MVTGYHAMRRQTEVLNRIACYCQPDKKTDEIQIKKESTF